MIVSDSIQDKPVSSPRSPHRQRAPPVPKISTPVPDRVAIFSSLLVRLPPARIPLLVSTLVKGRPSLERNLNRGHSIQLDVRGLEDAQWQALLSLMAAA